MPWILSVALFFPCVAVPLAVAWKTFHNNPYPHGALAVLLVISITILWSAAIVPLVKGSSTEPPDRPANDGGLN